MSAIRSLGSSVCWFSTTLPSNLLLHQPVGDGDALHRNMDVHRGSGSSKPLTVVQAASNVPPPQVVACCAGGSLCTVTFTLEYLFSAAWTYCAAAVCGCAVDAVMVNVSGPPRSAASWSNSCCALAALNDACVNPESKKGESWRNSESTGSTSPPSTDLL